MSGWTDSMIGSRRDDICTNLRCFFPPAGNTGQNYFAGHRAFPDRDRLAGGRTPERTERSTALAFRRRSMSAEKKESGPIFFFETGAFPHLTNREA